MSPLKHDNSNFERSWNWLVAIYLIAIGLFDAGGLRLG